MGNKDKHDPKKMEKVGKVFEALVAGADLSGHYQEVMKMQERMSSIKHEAMYEAPKKQLSQSEMVLEKMKSLNSVMEAGHDEHQKEKKRRLEQQHKEAEAGKASRQIDQNKRELLSLEKKKSDVERRKNEIEKKQKEKKNC